MGRCSRNSATSSLCRIAITITLPDMDFSLDTSHMVWVVRDLRSTVASSDRKGFTSVADCNPATDSSEAGCNRNLGCSPGCINLFYGTLSMT